MRDFNGNPIIPPADHTYGIYGIKELIYSYKTKADAEKVLARLRAEPDGPARSYALKYTVRKFAR